MLQITPDGFTSSTSSLASRTDVSKDNLVRRVLDKYNLTQAQLAHLMGVQPLAISRWLHGKDGMRPLVRMVLEGLEQGYALPDHIREKHVGKPKLGMQWRKVRK